MVQMKSRIIVRHRLDMRINKGDISFDDMRCIFRRHLASVVREPTNLGKIPRTYQRCRREVVFEGPLKDYELIRRRRILLHL